MTVNEQVISKGSIVQSRKHGWQGIVTAVSDSLWAAGMGRANVDVDAIREYMEMQSPPITEEDATTQRWVQASNFACMDFTAPESDLMVIPVNMIQLKDYPCAFVGRLECVEKQLDSDHVLLILNTNLTKTTTCKVYTNSLFIEHPTVVPMVGDSICGTQDFVIIGADGLDYPYRKVKNVLTQDW